MPHDQVVPPILCAETPAYVQHELSELGQEYVVAGRWAEYSRFLAACYDDYAEATTAAELEEWLACVSFVTESYLVESCWKAYRKGILQLATDLGLDPAQV